MCSSISFFTWVVEPGNIEIVVIAKYYVAKVQYVLVTCYLFVVNWYLFSFVKKGNIVNYTINLLLKIC